MEFCKTWAKSLNNIEQIKYKKYHKIIVSWISRFVKMWDCKLSLVTDFITGKSYVYNIIKAK